MSVQTQIAITMVENDQKPGAAQPVSENHSPSVHGMYLTSGRSADHDAVPFGPLVITARFTEACKQSTIDGPWKFSLGLCKRSAVRNTGTGNQRAGAFDRTTRSGFIIGFAAVAGDGLGFTLTLLFCFLCRQQRFLACLFGFAGLSGQRLFNGLQDLGQIGLVLLTGLQLLVAGLVVLIKFSQSLLTFLANLGQFFCLAVEVALLNQQLRLLQVDVFADVGQLTQGFIEVA